MSRIETLEGALRRANRLVALVLGVALVGTVLFVLIDVIGRKTGWGSLGGSDEISGYVMAAVASWGLSCALLDRAHVRIDLIRQKLNATGQGLMDIFAMIVTNGVVLLIAYQCWPVLQKTIERGLAGQHPARDAALDPAGHLVCRLGVVRPERHGAEPHRHRLFRARQAGTTGQHHRPRLGA